MEVCLMGFTCLELFALAVGAFPILVAVGYGLAALARRCIEAAGRGADNYLKQINRGAKS